LPFFCAVDVVTVVAVVSDVVDVDLSTVLPQREMTWGPVQSPRPFFHSIPIYSYTAPAPQTILSTMRGFTNPALAKIAIENWDEFI